MVSGEIVADLIADPADPRLYRFHEGGQGANVALALARQGVPTTLLMPLSQDTCGRHFAGTLSGAGVQLPLAGASMAPSSLALVSIDGGEPRYSLYREGVSDRDLDAARLLAHLPQKPAVYVVGAFCFAAEPDRSVWLEVAAEARWRGALISSDPNIRPPVMRGPEGGRPGMLAALAEADIVKASEEDLAYLLPALDAEAAANSLLARTRAALVVVTRGARGAILASRSARVVTPARPARPLKDTVGAGDTFHAAMIARLLRNGIADASALAALTASDLEALGHEANLAASLNCEQEGCNPPTRAAIDQALAPGP